MPERITVDTAVNPIDQYGQDKVLAEAAVRASGLPYALFRLGGVMSPDTTSSINSRLPAPAALAAGRQPDARGGRAGCGARIR